MESLIAGIVLIFVLCIMAGIYFPVKNHVEKRIDRDYEDE